MTTTTAFESEIICARLREAGIVPVEENEMIALRRLGNRRPDIYVDDADLARARAVLKEAESVSEDELIRLSEGGGGPEGAS
jgi:hypothetical protein